MGESPLCKRIKGVGKGDHMRAHKKIIASMVLAGTLAFAGILAATGCANNSSSSSDEATSSQAAVGQMKSLDE